MIKRLLILLITVSMIVPATAQSRGYVEQKYNDFTCADFGPLAGKWQISMMFGSPTYFLEDWNDFAYLLPEENSVGLGLYPAQYLNLGSMNKNKASNMIGIRGSYFFADRWELNLSFNMNINLTPSKDYVEGDFTIEDMPIPDHEWVMGTTSHLWGGQIGTNYYWDLCNGKVGLYTGLMAGFQMGRVETILPNYIGDDRETGEPLQMYYSSYNAGQAWAVQGAITGGIEYALAPGLFLGFEINPVLYQYSVFDLRPSTTTAYVVPNHNIKIFSNPMLRIGIRF